MAIGNSDGKGSTEKALETGTERQNQPIATPTRTTSNFAKK